MKHLIRGAAAITVLSLATSSALALTVSGKDGQKTYELKVADWFPTSNPISVDGAKFWMNEVTQASKGAVKFKYYPAGQLAAARDLLSITQSGLTDIGATAPEFNADKLPLSTVGNLPGLFEESCRGTRVLWKMSTEGGILFEKEFKPQHIHPLILAVTPQYELLSASKPIRTPADAKGLTIRSAGGTKDLTIQAIGATPVSISPAEMYQALKLGTVNAVAFPYSNAAAYSLQEVAKFGTEGANLGSFVDLYAISDKTWNKLPKEIQQIMMQAGEKTSMHLCQALNDDTTSKIKLFEQAGTKIDKFDAQGVAAWKEATSGVIAKWVKQYSAQGLPAQEVIDNLKTIQQSLQ
ncbi:MAG TPA: TRAP transporter substrate-binding protein DctP [Castellaniella sp.]|uniref:TRAP transporter substrate-binding protein n=1 Tax=Castellaniella sp. TaxID=1955812 RepID=UPI002F0AF819